MTGTVLWAELCPPQICMLDSQHDLRMWLYLETEVFKEVTKVK